MALQWPEETERERAQKRNTLFGRPLIVDELLGSDPNEPKRRFGYWLPTLVVIAILVTIGLLLAIYGPLPTVFPRCGGCEMPGV